MSKYSRTFKVALAQQCLNGVSSPKALGKQLSIPHSQIRYWSKVYSFNGKKSFLPPKSPRTAKDKADILKRMWSENWSLHYTSAFYNLSSPGTLWVWLREFDQSGFQGLQPKQRGCTSMKKQSQESNDKSIDEMTVEELREELEYRRTEVAVLKKLEALDEMKRQQAKKKRQSSKG
ncbi:transposase [Marinomonas sp. RSW2]|uniref:Transposase n=1 Tax=Marinomonas maritima TaxID=2940935 RepID=A0ABT5WDK5_9GAMM|nr:transposase [Marinomonas maritima]MDE8602908.1 transposase [Marinomonas maritima]MDE8604019.1 transposase [Marinomonas maritima]